MKRTAGAASGAVSGAVSGVSMRRLSRSVASLPAAIFASSSVSASTTTLASGDGESSCSAGTIVGEEFVTEDAVILAPEVDPAQSAETEQDAEDPPEYDEHSARVVTQYLEDARYLRRQR